MDEENFTVDTALAALEEACRYEEQIYEVLIARRDGKMLDNEALDRLTMLMYAHMFTIQAIAEQGKDEQ